MPVQEIVDKINAQLGADVSINLEYDSLRDTFHLSSNKILRWVDDQGIANNVDTGKIHRALADSMSGQGWTLQGVIYTSQPAAFHHFDKMWPYVELEVDPASFQVQRLSTELIALGEHISSNDTPTQQSFGFDLGCSFGNSFTLSSTKSNTWEINPEVGISGPTATGLTGSGKVGFKWSTTVSQTKAYAKSELQSFTAKANVVVPAGAQYSTKILATKEENLFSFTIRGRLKGFICPIWKGSAGETLYNDYRDLDGLEASIGVNPTFDVCQVKIDSLNCVRFNTNTSAVPPAG